jgi:hypothetical protein
LWFCAVTVDIIVECELFAGFDTPFSKDSHTKLIPHHPFVDVTVWVAGVIAEASHVALACRIYEFTLVERHEIKVFDAFFIVLMHSSAEGVFTNDLANVLENKVMGT